MKSTMRKSLILMLSFVLILNIFTYFIPTSATAANVPSTDLLNEDINSCTGIKETAKPYIKTAIANYIKTDTLKNALESGNTLIFFFEGGSSNYSGNETYTDTRNNAVLLLIKEISDVPRLYYSNNNFSTLPCDPKGLGNYKETYYNDPTDPYSDEKQPCGGGILKDGIYSFCYNDSPKYKYTERYLPNTRSIYLAPLDQEPAGYRDLPSTDILIHHVKSQKPAATNGLSWAYSIGCLISNDFESFINTVPNSGYVIVNRILFKDTLQRWFSTNKKWSNDAVDAVLENSYNICSLPQDQSPPITPPVENSKYFRKCTPGHDSLVNALMEIGVDSSLSYRKKIAAENLISNYTGTAAQNTKMLNLLKSGKLYRPDIAIYRLYNPNTGEHFYTGSPEERDNLKEVGWEYEGIAFSAPPNTGEPVYRLFNPNNGDHHYTMSLKERNDLVAVGWIYEDIAFNSAPTSGIPQYRMYNPNANTGNHHYAGSIEERNYLLKEGWKYEGIGFYGLPIGGVG